MSFDDQKWSSNQGSRQPLGRMEKRCCLWVCGLHSHSPAAGKPACTSSGCGHRGLELSQDGNGSQSIFLSRGRSLVQCGAGWAGLRHQEQVSTPQRPHHSECPGAPGAVPFPHGDTAVPRRQSSVDPSGKGFKSRQSPVPSRVGAPRHPGEL